MIQNNNVENIIMDKKKIVATVRQNIAREINSKLLQAYWEIGRAIVENEQNGDVSPK